MAMSSARSPSTRTAAIDAAEMRRRLAGDSELIRDVARTFLENLPRLRDDVRRARDRQDSAQLQQAIHCLRGALLDVAALRAAELAGKLEHAGVGRNQELAALLTLLDEVAQDVDALLAPS
jgi:HPt (histidine-containing phosphotransfer) domain-containing protein